METNAFGYFVDSQYCSGTTQFGCCDHLPAQNAVLQSISESLMFDFDMGAETILRDREQQYLVALIIC